MTPAIVTRFDELMSWLALLSCTEFESPKDDATCPPQRLIDGRQHIYVSAACDNGSQSTHRELGAAVFVHSTAHAVIICQNKGNVMDPMQEAVKNDA